MSSSSGSTLTRLSTLASYTIETITITRTETTTSNNVGVSTSSYSAPQNPSTFQSTSTSKSQPAASYYATSTPLESTRASSINTLSTSSSISANTTSSLSPTLLPSVPSSKTPNHTLLIALLSAVFIFLVSVVLAAIFVRRRRHQNKNDFLARTLIQKKNSRAQLLVGEDMNDVASPTASSGVGSFGRDVFGKIIGGRDTRRDGGGGPYQDITHAYAAPLPSMTPWDSPRDPRSLMEALHHPSRVQPSEAKRYMSQYLSRRTETDTWQDMGVSARDGREFGGMRAGSLVEPTRRTSVVDLRVIVDSVLGPGARPYSPQSHTWSPVSSASTYSTAEGDKRYI